MRAFLLALGVVFGFLLWAAFDSSLIPLYVEVCDEAAEAGQQKCAAKLYPLYLFFKLLEALNYYAALVAALVTAVIAWFTWSLTDSTRKQWQASSKQADIAEASLTKLNRPFVLPGLLMAFPERDAAKKIASFSLRLQLKNEGNSPAMRVTFFVNYIVLRSEMPDDFDFGDRRSVDGRPSTPVVIGIKSHTTTGTFSVPIETIREIWAKNYRLYLWGWITYEDIFGLRTTPYRTQFCWEVEIYGDEPIAPAGELEFRCMTHHRHNCIDEDCP